MHSPGRFPATQTIRAVKALSRQVYRFAYHRPKLALLRESPDNTRVAVARKLAVLLHRMWSDQTEFRFGKEPGTAARLAIA
jgi:hypothetical protein